MGVLRPAFGWFSLWVIPVALVVLILVYQSVLIADQAYTSLLRSCFDLHRFNLYQMLHWPLPESPASKVPCGQAITQYLQRGAVNVEQHFQKNS